MNKQLKEVTYARMHSTIFIPGAGQYGPELVSTASSSGKPVSMTLEDNLVVVCRIKDKQDKSVTFVIPLTNFTNLVVNEENS